MLHAHFHRTSEDGSKFVTRSYKDGKKLYNGLMAHFRNWPEGKAFITRSGTIFRSAEDVEDYYFIITAMEA